MKHKIVTICGSMRYYNQMLALANELSLEGKIVLLPFVLKIDDPGVDESLQKLHRAKIDMSDEVYIIIYYYGASVQEEMLYAKENGKTIYMLHDRDENGKLKFPSIGDQNAWQVTQPNAT